VVLPCFSAWWPGNPTYVHYLYIIYMMYIILHFKISRITVKSIWEFGLLFLKVTRLKSLVSLKITRFKLA